MLPPTPKTVKLYSSRLSRLEVSGLGVQGLGGLGLSPRNVALRPGRRVVPWMDTARAGLPEAACRGLQGLGFRPLRVWI